MKLQLKATLGGHEWKDECSNPDLSPDQWQTVMDLRKVLNKPAIVSDALQADRYTTVSSVAPMMVKIKSFMNDCITTLPTTSKAGRNVATHIAATLAEHWDHPTLLEFVCCLLDPRFRNLNHLGKDITLEEKNAAWAELQRVFNRFKCIDQQEVWNIDFQVLILSCAKKQDMKHATAASAASASSSAAALPASDSDPLVGAGAEPEAKPTALRALGIICHSAPTALLLGDEISTYRYSVLHGVSDETQPLGWWAEQADSYPVLSRVARAYLCIPATSAASERVFSTAGNIVTARRARLSPANVEQSVFLAYNHHLY